MAQGCQYVNVRRPAGLVQRKRGYKSRGTVPLRLLWHVNNEQMCGSTPPCCTFSFIKKKNKAVVSKAVVILKKPSCQNMVSVYHQYSTTSQERNDAVIKSSSGGQYIQYNTVQHTPSCVAVRSMVRTLPRCWFVLIYNNNRLLVFALYITVYIKNIVLATRNGTKCQYHQANNRVRIKASIYNRVKVAIQ